LREKEGGGVPQFFSGLLLGGEEGERSFSLLRGGKRKKGGRKEKHGEEKKHSAERERKYKAISIPLWPGKKRKGKKRGRSVTEEPCVSPASRGKWKEEGAASLSCGKKGTAVLPRTPLAKREGKSSRRTRCRKREKGGLFFSFQSHAMVKKKGGEGFRAAFSRLRHQSVLELEKGEKKRKPGPARGREPTSPSWQNDRRKKGKEGMLQKGPGPKRKLRTLRASCCHQRPLERGKGKRGADKKKKKKKKKMGKRKKIWLRGTGKEREKSRIFKR